MPSLDLAVHYLECARLALREVPHSDAYSDRAIARSLSHVTLAVGETQMVQRRVQRPEVRDARA